MLKWVTNSSKKTPKERLPELSRNMYYIQFCTTYIIWDFFSAQSVQGQCLIWPWFSVYYFFSVFFPMLLLRFFACENRLSMNKKVSFTSATAYVILQLIDKRKYRSYNMNTIKPKTNTQYPPKVTKSKTSLCLNE